MKNVFILLTIFFLSCSSKENNKEESSNTTPTNVSSSYTYSESYSSYDSEEDYGIEDGTHSASVDYYNPNTGTSNSYYLDVEVEDGQVVCINFPNGGYLDDSHIDVTEVDDDGSCTIYDDEGREYYIQIED